MTASTSRRARESAFWALWCEEVEDCRPAHRWSENHDDSFLPARLIESLRGTTEELVP